MNVINIQQQSLQPYEANKLKETDKLNDFIDQYLKWLDVAKDTERAYKSGLRYFMGWLQEKGISTPQKEHIVRYKQSLVHKAQETQALYLSAVRGFFKYLEAEEIHKDITKGVKIKRSNTDLYTRSHMTVDEVRMLLESIDTTTILGLRDFAMVNLMVRTGIREIEVHRANVGDIIEKDGRTIMAVQRKGKTHKQGFVILNDKILEPLKLYIGNDRDVTAPMFLSHAINYSGIRLGRWSIRHIIATRLIEAGLKRKDIVGHSLRHSFSVNAIENGATMEQLQIELGHSSPATTARYAKGINRLKNAVVDRITF